MIVLGCVLWLCCPVRRNSYIYKTVSKNIQQESIINHIMHHSASLLRWFFCCFSHIEVAHTKRKQVRIETAFNRSLHSRTKLFHVCYRIILVEQNRMRVPHLGQFCKDKKDFKNTETAWSCLWSDRVFNADHTQTDEVRDDFLLIVPVWLNVHVLFVGGSLLCGAQDTLSALNTFIACQHTKLRRRDSVMAILSVRPSVRPSHTHHVIVMTAKRIYQFCITYYCFTKC